MRTLAVLPRALTHARVHPASEWASLGIIWVAELSLGWEFWNVHHPPQPAELLAPLFATINVAALRYRRRHPVLVFAVVAQITAVGSWVPNGHLFVSLLVALFTAVSEVPRGPALQVLAVAEAALAIFSAFDGPITTGRVILAALVWLFVSGVVWVVARRLRDNARQLADLEQRRAAAAADAVAAERVRLARELHDIVAHAVSVMVLQAAGARTVIGRDPRRADQALVAVEDVGQQAMGELRRLLGVLRSAAGDDADELGNPPGLADLPDLIRQAESAGLRVTMQESGTPGALAPSVGLAAYRLVQEALTNTVKHAADGAVVEVLLTWQGGRDDVTALEVTVEDRPGPATRWPGGRGADPADPAGGLGLLGLRERMAAAGGRFEAGPTARGGFLVRATLPAGAVPGPLAATA